MKKYTLIGPFKQILTMGGLPLKGALLDQQLTIIENGGIIIVDEKIYAVGPYAQVSEEANNLNAENLLILSEMICIPGFIDTHTHICFGGSRANDYALRNSGKTYLEIAKSGGGIWDTVTQTRKASTPELISLITERAERHINHGVTTIEVKSGYGLSVQEELKMLRAMASAREECKSDLVPTCLAAHMVPKDNNGTADDYLLEISTELFPILKKERLTQRIDAFIEEGAFSPTSIAPYFDRAKEMGFDITVHADQFSTGGSAVAVKYNAISADHLEASGEKEIQLLAKSNTIATALPGASIGLGCNYTPARKLLDAGAAVAIASDWNPGSAPMGNLLTQAAILGTFEKLTNAEVLAGITYRAAAALGLRDRGKIETGLLADLIAFPTGNYKEILYQQGMLLPSLVWKKGRLAVEV
ncbi:imidazolonepropionase [Arenibacter sp. BSSL-BM3]|uniref:Imidazolonepropionase n=1 Tax=Arenibacter arenosicollis TaxID=2762274 RepID=A0ABR7QM68_9FLAO|nr:imidazolonepropionase [Arenibacter arenosicollis]MBC8768281.1 imidazolonepropionase [Arenibacter arenosicollis]